MQANTRVEKIEVKRCFVASEKIKRQLQTKSEIAFQEILAEVGKEVWLMSESELDRLIAWHPRLTKYNELIWHFEECSIDELGVWLGAGGLLEEWCYGSVRETTNYIRNEAKKIAQIKKYGYDKRAIDEIPAIVKVADKILVNRLLAPIVVPGGTWRPTPPCRKMKGDIDDGNLRVIAFAIKGYEKFNAYVGKQSNMDARP